MASSTAGDPNVLAEFGLGIVDLDLNVWSGRAVQEDFDDQQMRSCINVSGLCLERSTPGHHGYQRACELISGQASTGPFGSPVFACAGKTDSPFRLIVSQTSAGKDVGYVIDSSSLRAVPLFVPGGRSFVPACARRRAARKGPSRAGRRAVPASCAPCCQAAP